MQILIVIVAIQQISGLKGFSRCFKFCRNFTPRAAPAEELLIAQLIADRAERKEVSKFTIVFLINI
jgi:hypothetical protein